MSDVYNYLNQKQIEYWRTRNRKAQRWVCGVGGLQGT